MKEMKSIIIILSILFAVTLFASSALADPQIQVSSSVNPSTVAPGTDGYVQLTFTNTGTSSADTLQIKGFSAGPYLSVSESGIVNLGSLGSGKSTTALVKFSVSSSAPSGLYTIDFSIDYCTTGCNEIDSTAVVTVQASSSLQVLSVQPDTLAAGETSTLNFNLVNNGAGAINSILFTWRMPDNEILPLGISSTRYIASLNGGSSLTIPVNVSVSSSVTPGIYPLTTVLSYFDKSGVRQNVSSIIGIKIGGTTNFDIGLQQYSAGTLSLSIANIGVNPATSVSVSIPEQSNYAVSGATSTFLGNLNSGDFSVANFQITSRMARNTGIGTNGQTAGEINTSGQIAQTANVLIVQISYSDTSGARQLVQKEISLNIATSQSTAALGQRSRGLSFMTIVWIVIIIAIVIAAVLLWFFKFRKKKNFLSQLLERFSGKFKK
jgi:hypothetical protein